ncbi:hypothetical protein [Paenibacillus pini]|uniref:hypothetical protein n=1 Tax=Paenibacillus pini TaxID=669461 RepID=UPI00056A2EBB|nr:hypothetical protein [Paenibacillus pini]
MKCNFVKQTKSNTLSNVGDVFITTKGNPHMVIYNRLSHKPLQVIKLSGERQARVIKSFDTMKELINNYEVDEVIKSRNITITRR